MATSTSNSVQVTYLHIDWSSFVLAEPEPYKPPPFLPPPGSAFEFLWDKGEDVYDEGDGDEQQQPEAKE